MAQGRATANSNKQRSTNLVAVLLLTRSRPGPRLVFHYPSQPLVNDHRHDTVLSYDDNSDGDSDNDTSRAQVASDRNAVTVDAGNGDAQPSASAQPQDSGSDTSVLGSSRDALEKLLSPGRWCDRKKFEICLDQLVFTGHPIFADQDGNWRKDELNESLEPPVETKASSSSPDDGQNQAAQDDQPEDGTGGVDITITSPPTPAKAPGKFDHVPDSFEDRTATSLATSMRSTSTQSANVAEQLTMFHVVFVARPSGKHTGADFHQHLAKRLSKALQYCQKQFGYVATESRQIQAIRTKGRADNIHTAALWSQICDSSELAWALKEIFEKTSRGEIAGFRLAGLEMSLQLPMDDDFDPYEPLLSPHASLLLLEEKIALLRNLTHPDATPLAAFIRGHTPTKSLEKNAGNLGMSIGNVMYIARHLVKWRKARIIAPLHARNIYILNPVAPLQDLSHYIGDYARKFSALPTLANMLNSLSGRPTKYGSLIPSRDHRAPYMDILAYLVQHRFVIQLKTFGWLHTPTTDVNSSSAGQSAVNKNRRPLSVARLLSPQLRPTDDDNVSVSSDKTAIPLSLNELSRATSNEETGNSTKGEANGAENEVAAVSRRIILDPVDASDEDADALAVIRNVIEDEELRARFESLLIYFDGEHALEEIAAHEGVKRSKVESWIEALLRGGVLETFRRL